MLALDIRPDLPRMPSRGLERPKPKYPPIWRGATAHTAITGPDAMGRYRIQRLMQNSYCITEQYGPTEVCVVGDYGFLVVVWLEGDVR